MLPDTDRKGTKRRTRAQWTGTRRCRHCRSRPLLRPASPSSLQEGSRPSAPGSRTQWRSLAASSPCWPSARVQISSTRLITRSGDGGSNLSHPLHPSIARSPSARHQDSTTSALPEERLGPLEVLSPVAHPANKLEVATAISIGPVDSPSVSWAGLPMTFSDVEPQCLRLRTSIALSGRLS